MSRSFVVRHNCIILDACCAINLLASERAAEILQSIGKPVAVAEYVYSEEILRLDPSPLVEAGLLSVEIPSEAENLLTVNFAVGLDDGEAVTCSLAVSRNWAIGIDERKAISTLARTAPQIQVVSSLELIQHWATAMGQSDSTIREALENVRAKASYEPNRNHTLRGWWEKYMLE